MPVSYHEPYAMYQVWVRQNQPKDAWDIGMGYGNIGAMAKQIIPDIELNGIDIFVPYLVDLNSHAKLYKRIIIADIRDCLDKMWPVDMITAFDIIEHLPKEDGIKVMNGLKCIAKKGLLVAMPIVDYPQESYIYDMYGVKIENKAERHLSQWKVEDMIELGAKVLFKGQVCGLFQL
jgi:trans-aconitate methyltransferase